MNNPLPTPERSAELMKWLRDSAIKAEHDALLAEHCDEDDDAAAAFKRKAKNARDAADALEALSAWQPIESVPEEFKTNGTEILACSNNAWQICPTIVHWQDGLWYREDEEYSEYGLRFLTHWRHLPHPPKEEEGAEALEKEAGR